jgi:signal peptidase I
MEFDGRYGPLDNLVPQADDLAPARLGSRGAPLEFSHLRLRRDVYYTDTDRPSRNGGRAAGSDPWRQDAAAYWLGPDQFLMLGDNSPQSKDSRLWNDSEYFVSRELLIGKALFIYWPHSLDHLPGTDIWFPLFPNFGRMGFIK